MAVKCLFLLTIGKRIDEKLGFDEQEFFNIFQELDSDGNGKLNLNEFHNFFSQFLNRVGPLFLLGCAVFVVWVVVTIIIILP